jgi:hypothetical protein
MDQNPSDFTVNPIPPTPAPAPAPAAPHLMSKKIFKWLILLAIGLAAVSVLIFFFGSSPFSENGVHLTITGPTQVSVGDEVVYKVDYTNTTKTALNNLHLTFNYPDGSIILKDGQVVNNPTHIETVDQATLNPGQTEEKEFHAFLIGEKGNIKTAKVALSFEAGNLKSQFEQNAEAATTITDVPVGLTLSASPNAVSGNSVTYVLDYRNQSQDQISGLRATFTYPEGFVPRSTAPAPAQGSTWTIKTLRPGEGGRITVTGTLSGKEGESKNVVVALQRSINGSYVDYERTNAATVISSPLMDVSLAVNGSPTYVSHLGDTLDYTVTYKNTSSYTLSGVGLSVRLDGIMYDLSSVNARNSGFFDSGARTVNWNSGAISDFDNLRPNQSGSVTFSVKLKPAFSGTGAGSFFVHATALLATQNVPDGIDATEIDAQDDIVTNITSQPVFDELLYYNDAAFGSTGPVPPRVGQETVYTVHWRITNPGNQLTGARIVGTLPQGVTWKNVIGVGANQPQPTYNKNSGQVIWNLGTVPQGVGISSDKYELSFQVSVKPSSNQSGSSITLVQNATLSATDGVTQQAIVVPKSDVTTSNTVDQPGQGTVQ